MKRSNFDNLIDRYLAGEVTEYERAKIEAWLNVMKTERTTDLELSEETGERLFRKITDPQESVDDVIALYPRQPLLKRILTRQWVRIAASVTVLLSISFAVWNALDSREPAQVVASGSREKLILNDGTLVWLQEGSKFSYYQKEDGTRQAELTGEALFEVAKIPNSIFTITCGDITVRVLGTSFNLRTEEKAIEVKVLTGKVSLSSPEDATGISVSSNEKVIYTAKGIVERAALESKEASAVTADTEYNMYFDNTTMDEVIEKIERKFNVNVTVADSHLLQCRVTVNLTDNSLNSTLAMLPDLLDVSYRIDGRRVELSGKGCE